MQVTSAFSTVMTTARAREHGVSEKSVLKIAEHLASLRSGREERTRSESRFRSKSAFCITRCRSFSAFADTSAYVFANALTMSESTVPSANLSQPAATPIRSGMRHAREDRSCTLSFTQETTSPGRRARARRDRRSKVTPSDDARRAFKKRASGRTFLRMSYQGVVLSHERSALIRKMIGIP